MYRKTTAKGVNQVGKESPSHVSQRLLPSGVESSTYPVAIFWFFFLSGIFLHSRTLPLLLVLMMRAPLTPNGLTPSQQLAYFRNVLGLDEGSSILMIKGESFQRKGQLDLAEECFSQVLLKYPNTLEIRASMRMVQTENASSPNTVSYGLPSETGNHEVCMSVSWIGTEDSQRGYTAEPDDCARRAAHEQIARSNCNWARCSLNIVSNVILGRKCSEETGWELVIWGRAHVQVTCDTNSQAKPLDWKTFQHLEKIFGRDRRGTQFPQTDV